MIPPGFGWSVGDIVLAIKVIQKVTEAFREANGADKQYEATVSFLDAFGRTLDRVKEYVFSQEDESSLGADLTAQLKLIYAEYSKFDGYLKKVEPGLSSASFTRRVVAKTKWAIKEINQKVAELKKAILAPMMFVTPLLAVETLQQLKEIRQQLADDPLREQALRENHLLILKVNENLANLHQNLNAYWWNRRWAMSAVEEDVKSLNLAIKNNSDLLASAKNEMKETVEVETQKLRQETSTANLNTLIAVETVMETRLAWMESKIDVLISTHRAQTGKEDKELHSIKQRLSNSRQNLKEVAGSARRTLKHFGLFVKAVNHMHGNAVTRLILPLADTIIGYDAIFEHGQKMVKGAGDTMKASGKYVEESDMMKSLKGWNPFGGGGGKSEAATSPPPGAAGNQEDDQLSTSGRGGQISGSAIDFNNQSLLDDAKPTNQTVKKNDHYTSGPNKSILSPKPVSGYQKINILDDMEDENSFNARNDTSTLVPSQTTTTTTINTSNNPSIKSSKWTFSIPTMPAIQLPPSMKFPLSPNKPTETAYTSTTTAATPRTGHRSLLDEDDLPDMLSSIPSPPPPYPSSVSESVVASSPASAAGVQQQNSILTTSTSYSQPPSQPSAMPMLPDHLAANPWAD